MVGHSLSRPGAKARIDRIGRQSISRSRCGTVWERGFSLLELLVVVALATIAATIAVPNGTRNIQAARLGAAVQEMSYRIGETRMRAIALNTRTRLILMTLQKQHQVQILEGEVWSSDGSPIKLPASTSVLQGGTVEFLPSGLAVNGVTFEIGSGEDTMKVFISRAGGIIY